MTVLDDVLKEIDREAPASIERLFALLRIESISTDPAYRDSCRAAADWLVKELGSLGFDASARESSGHPVVVAHDRDPASGPHALFYAHYDVQPVDPLDLWELPPFEPRLVDRDGSRVIAARGASDDKGQLMTFVEACRAWKRVTGRLPARVSLILEGEEESGSPSLVPFLKANADELKADIALICDTGMWDAGRPAITTMLRGLVGQEVIITAANRDLHSGVYGGAARNPIHVLTKILSDLHDDAGRVALPGFYDGVPDVPTEIKKQWDGLDFDPAEFLGGIGLSQPAGESGRSVLEMVWSRPTAEVNGVIGGYTGSGFKTVIPSKASAKVSFRLVGDQNPEKIAASFQEFVRARVPADCKAEFVFHGASPAIRLPLAGKYLTAARKALAEEWSSDPVLVGSGGSIPIAGDFQRVLGLDSLMIGFGLEDDRIHSPNEKYNLSSYQGGIRSWARILAAIGSLAD